MSARAALVVAALLALAGPVTAQEVAAQDAASAAPVTTTTGGDPPAPPPREAEPLGVDEARARGVGSPAPKLRFGTLDGLVVELTHLARDGALVVVLTSLRCPIARLYAPAVAELAARHPGARFLVVGVAARDTPDELRAAARQHGWTAPIQVTAAVDVAHALRAARTTECFVLDREGVLRYRGAIDDQYGQGYRRAAPRRRLLDDALTAVLAGEPVAVPATTAPGCVLPPPPPPREE